MVSQVGNDIMDKRYHFMLAGCMPDRLSQKPHIR